MPHDQFVNTMYKAEVNALKEWTFRWVPSFKCGHNLIYIQQQINFCSFDLGNKEKLPS